MTVDFRDPRAAQQMQQPALAPQYRLILGVLAISAVLMCAGALWFWMQPPAMAGCADGAVFGPGAGPDGGG
jgi:hypothetical protein